MTHLLPTKLRCLHSAHETQMLALRFEPCHTPLVGLFYVRSNIFYERRTIA
jgi:hypothetical protein